MEKLRQQVVTDIRLNQQLEADLNQMDIKIGLLVKNRITLQVQHDTTGIAWHFRYSLALQVEVMLYLLCVYE